MGVSVPAIGLPGRIIDVLLSARRDLAAARRFFILALRAGTILAGSPPTAPRPIREPWTS